MLWLVICLKETLFEQITHFPSRFTKNNELFARHSIFPDKICLAPSFIKQTKPNMSVWKLLTKRYSTPNKIRRNPLRMFTRGSLFHSAYQIRTQTSGHLAGAKPVTASKTICSVTKPPATLETRCPCPTPPRPQQVRHSASAWTVAWTCTTTDQRPVLVPGHFPRRCRFHPTRPQLTTTATRIGTALS